MSFKLTDTQLVILSAAGRREDRCLTAPSNLKGGAAHKVAAKLLAAGVVREMKAKTEMDVWRRDEKTGQAYSLKLTAAGLKAIAIEDRGSQSKPSEELAPNANDGPSKTTSVANMPTTPTETVAPLTKAPRQRTKIARVIELLQRDEGAKLGELTSVTGWLPHTARAALTGLRHRGYDIRLERGETGSASVYRAVEILAAAS